MKVTLKDGQNTLDLLLSVVDGKLLILTTEGVSVGNLSYEVSLSDDEKSILPSDQEFFLHFKVDENNAEYSSKNIIYYTKNTTQ